jgi:hypothetical protein
VAPRGQPGEKHWLVGAAGAPEIIHLDQRGVRITSAGLSLGNAEFPLGSIRKAWVETRRPGLIHGAFMLALGAFVLVRGAVFLKAIGVLLMAFGFVRLRATVHVVRLELASGKVSDALKTPDHRWAAEVLRAIEAARSTPSGAVAQLGA